MPIPLKKVCSSMVKFQPITGGSEGRRANQLRVLEKELHQDWRNVAFQRHITSQIMQLSLSPPSNSSQLHVLIQEQKWIEIKLHFKLKSKKEKGSNITKNSLFRKFEKKTTSSNLAAQLLLRDEHGRTPLFLILRRRASDNLGLERAPYDLIAATLKACPSAAAVPDSRKNFPLQIAVVHGHRKNVLRALIQCYPGAGIERNESLDTPLILAVNFSREAGIGRPSGLSRGKPDLVKPIDSPLSHLYAKQDELNESMNRKAFSSSKRWDVVLLLLRYNPEAACIRNRHGMSVLEMALQRHAPFNVIRSLIRADKMAVTVQHPVVLSSSVGVHHGDFPSKASCRDGVITPLLLAVRREANEEILEMLSYTYPDALSLHDEYGLTPLSSCWLQWFYATCLNSGLGICDPRRQAMVTNFFKTSVFHQEFLSVWQKLQTLLCASTILHGFSYARFHEKSLSGKNEYYGGSGTATNKPELSSNKESFVVHAAAAQDCPVEILEIAMRLYPSQVREKDSGGSLPLHLAAGAPVYVKQSYELDKNYNAIDLLSLAYPSGASVVNDRGFLPIHIAIRSGRKWEEGLSSLVMADSRSMRVRDPLTGLYPAQLAAYCYYSGHNSARSAKLRSVAQQRVGHSNWQDMTERQRDIMIVQCNNEELTSMTTLFELFRSEPSIISCEREQKHSNMAVHPLNSPIRSAGEVKVPYRGGSPQSVFCFV